MFTENAQLRDMARKRIITYLLEKESRESLTQQELFTELKSNNNTNNKSSNNASNSIPSLPSTSLLTSLSQGESVQKSVTSKQIVSASERKSSAKNAEENLSYNNNNNNSSNSNSSSSNSNSSKKKKKKNAPCWMCNNSLGTLYKLRDEICLCFKCFRLCYIALILPHIDNEQRRVHDKTFLKQIQEIEAEESLNATKVSSMNAATTTAAAASRTSNNFLPINNVVNKDVPEEASFVMNASFLKWQQVSRLNSSLKSASSSSNMYSTPGREGAHQVSETHRNRQQGLKTGNKPMNTPHGVVAANSNNIKDNDDTADKDDINESSTVRKWRDSCTTTSANEMQGVWDCPRCAYINMNDSKKCMACGLQNPGKIQCRRCGALCAIRSNGEVVITNGLVDRISQKKNDTSSAASAAAYNSGMVELKKGKSSSGDYSSTNKIVLGNTNVDTNAIRPNRNVCVDGTPHVLWFCNHCNRINTHDSEKCEWCASTRSWVCCFCTERQSTKRTEDGLRICRTCGAYNTPEDVFQGQIEVEKENNRNRLQEQLVVESKESAREVQSDTCAKQGDQEVVFGVNDPDTLAEQRRQVEIAENEFRLNKRLGLLSARRNVRVADGNCLFSALSNQLFGRPRLGHTVRSMIVHYMMQHSEDYSVLFPDGEWTRYVRQMLSPGFWGDELCLNAAARCFEVDIHVITSEVGHWHIVFQHKALTAVEEHGNASNISVSALSSIVPSRVGAGRNNDILQASEEQPSNRVVHDKMSLVDNKVVNVKNDQSSKVNTNSANRRENNPSGVCVFLSYLYPVHYDDVGNVQQKPLFLSRIILQGLMNVLQEIVTVNQPVKEITNSTRANTEEDKSKHNNQQQQNTEPYNSRKYDQEYMLWQTSPETVQQKHESYTSHKSAALTPQVESHETQTSRTTHASTSANTKSTIASEKSHLATSSKIESTVNYLLSVEASPQEPSSHSSHKNVNYYSHQQQQQQQRPNLRTKAISASNFELLDHACNNNENTNNNHNHNSISTSTMYDDNVTDRNSHSRHDKSLRESYSREKKSNSYSFFESGKCDSVELKNINNTSAGQRTQSVYDNQTVAHANTATPSSNNPETTNFTDSNKTISKNNAVAEQENKGSVDAILPSSKPAPLSSINNSESVSVSHKYKKESTEQTSSKGNAKKKDKFVAKIFQKAELA